MTNAAGLDFVASNLDRINEILDYAESVDDYGPVGGAILVLFGLTDAQFESWVAAEDEAAVLAALQEALRDLQSLGLKIYA